MLVENYSQYPAQTTLIGRLVQFFMAPKGAATLTNNSLKITKRANKQTTVNTLSMLIYLCSWLSHRVAKQSVRYRPRHLIGQSVAHKIKLRGREGEGEGREGVVG